MNNISCLLIDDEVKLTKSLAFTLGEAGIDCIEANDGNAGLQAATTHAPDLIILDVRLPDISGLDVLSELKTRMNDTPIIMISAHGDTKDAVKAMKIGASDYLTKPFDVDELILMIQETISKKQLKNEVQYLRKIHSSSGNIIGESPAMKELIKSVGRIAQSKAKTILLLGETGVGKAVIAREIHNRSGHPELPFIEINCAALPEELMEAELFGVEKGAYTGAANKRAGLVEIANNGTLFLDEIGELSMKLQAKLLTLLESWIYRPVGSSREKRADIRVIAATNRDLEQNVLNGTFRKDLFFRLNIMPIEIPKLIDRGNDFWLLITYFAETLANREGCPPIQFTEQVRQIFAEYKWPGNVREIKNLVERLTILYPGQEITMDQLPNEFLHLNGSPPSSINDTLEIAEKDLILRVLNECKGKKGLTAEKLGISRHALKRRIQRLGIE